MLSASLIADPVVDIIANATASTVSTAPTIVESLFRQATQPVQWNQSMQVAKQLLSLEPAKEYSPTTSSDPVAICVGPGTTIASFFKSAGLSSRCIIEVNDVDSIRSAANRLAARG